MKLKYTLPCICIALVITSAILINGCSDKKTSRYIDPAFTGYISAFTSGIISNGSSIKIRLMEEQDVELHEAIEEQLFEFSPDIKGEANWIDKRTIEFIPEGLLPSGKLFEAEFHLSKVADVPEKLNTLPFSFQTIQQAINVYFEGMRAYDIQDLKWQRLQGQLVTADQAIRSSN